MPSRVPHALFTLALLPMAAGAQAPAMGSRYLPMDHWAYEYIERLENRGILAGLNPLVQPYRRLDVARELARLGPDTLREPVAGWVRMLREEFARELSTLAGLVETRFGLEAMAGARGSTSRRLDPARPVGDEGAWPWWRGAAWLEAGPVAAESRLYGDTYFRADPDGINPGYDPRDSFGGQSDNAYLSVALPFGAFELGRFARNWGPAGTPGLMISPVATPYPSLGLEIRTGRVSLRSFTAELDSVGGAKRHLIAHRLDYTHGDLAFSLGEASLYVYPSPLLRFFNPAELFIFGQTNEPPQNVMLSAQLWLRRGPAVLYLDALLDDIDIAPETAQAEPPQYGFTLGARLVSLPPWIEVGTEYQQVGAWAYRTPNFTDRYSYFNRGLGANYSDYDRLTVWTHLYPPVRGLRVSPMALLQRQGEGNFRDSIPGGDYSGQPALFLGVKETTLRLGLRGRYQPFRQLWITWDVGPNLRRNRGHVLGVRETAFEAMGEVGLRLVFGPRRR